MSRDFPLIIADESVDFRIVQNLRDQGFSVYAILTESRGITDTDVIDIAIEKHGYIITEDKDFGDELVYRKTKSVGSMLIRITDLPVASKLKLVSETLIHQAEDLNNCFAVLTSKKLRIRKYI